MRVAFAAWYWRPETLTVMREDMTEESKNYIRPARLCE
jgi:hypothetical protein